MTVDLDRAGADRLFRAQGPGATIRGPVKINIEDHTCIIAVPVESDGTQGDGSLPDDVELDWATIGTVRDGRVDVDQTRSGLDGVGPAGSTEEDRCDVGGVGCEVSRDRREIDTRGDVHTRLDVREGEVRLRLHIRIQVQDIDVLKSDHGGIRRDCAVERDIVVVGDFRAAVDRDNAGIKLVGRHGLGAVVVIVEIDIERTRIELHRIEDDAAFGIGGQVHVVGSADRGQAQRSGVAVLIDDVRCRTGTAEQDPSNGVVHVEVAVLCVEVHTGCEVDTRRHRADTERGCGSDVGVEVNDRGGLHCDPAAGRGDRISKVHVVIRALSIDLNCPG